MITKVTPEGTLNYTYDAAGNLASMISGDGNVSVSYTWDSLNRLSTVVDNRLTGSTTTTYTYDAASNVVTVAYPNGVQTTLHYDSLNRLTAMTTPNTGYLYTLGPTGARSNATELTGRGINWSYDGIYRLTNETISGDPNKVNGGVSYGLDPVGNRLSATSSLTGINSGSFSFNADDELSSESYDADGNVLTSSGKAFAYDSEDRLKSMNGSSVTILYDGDGNRVAKTVSGVTTRYLVDDLNPTGYAQVVEETGATQRTYTYGLQRISENQVINGAWTPSFYGYDGFGSVRTLTNAAGATTDTYEYEAFGNELNSTGSTPNSYLYRGEFFDSDLGLYYLRARWMNPLTGRFLGRDPEDGIPADPMTLQKYVYADSNPVNASDPSGRAAAAEDIQVTVKIDIGALPALATFGCTVNIAYNVLALRFDTASNIQPTADCKAKGEGRMRVQLQLGYGNGKSLTVWGEAAKNQDPPGVTLSQVGGLLNGLWGDANSGTIPKYPKSENWDLYDAIIKVSLCAKSQVPGGVIGLNRSVCSEPVGKSGWRVDLDNLYGRNLTE